MAKAKRANVRTIPPDKTQVNFNISNEILDKIKYIALNEKVSNAELFNLALSRFITAYEEKNGKIKFRPKASGLSDL